MCQKQPPCCGTQEIPGRQLFISHQNAAPESRPDCFTVGLKGYGRPAQHPLYVTSSSVYGRHPPPPGLQAKRRAFHSRFTKTQALGGMYEDTHFTTETESQLVYTPANDTHTGP
ncbi:UPF0691 protein C9orf116 homolog [Aplysia californica]|uniref:UPF0691 protein C9orf116 homolog n=1 Tax=Aplysia californica TaxID=6500 RepID=A0ABM1A2Z5_APLCA|nr:UPF0691 protein C9orf116 homolog [Aplysia californica]